MSNPTMFPQEIIYPSRVTSVDILYSRLQNTAEQMLFLYMVHESIEEQKSSIRKVMFDMRCFTNANDELELTSYWYVCGNEIYVRVYEGEKYLGLSANDSFTNSALFSDATDAKSYLSELRLIEAAMALLTP